MGTKPTKVREYKSYAETAVVQHVEQGKTTYRQYNSVNEPIRVPATEQTNLITKVRVTTLVEEDKGVYSNGTNYEKTIETVQERDGGLNAPNFSASVGGPTGAMHSPAGSAPQGNENPCFTQVLAEKVRGLAARVDSLDGWAKLAVAMAGLALLAAGIALAV